MITLIQNVLTFFLIVFPHYFMLFPFANIFSSYVAKLFGDREPERQGFLSLRIRNHLIPEILALFTLIMSLVNALLRGSGAVSIGRFAAMTIASSMLLAPQINSKNYSRPLHAIITIFARTGSKFLYSFILIVIMQTIPIDLNLIQVSGTWQSGLWVFLDYGTVFAIYFALLDLLPFPSSASGKVLEILMTDEQKESFDWYFEHGDMVLFLLIMMPGLNNIYFAWMHKKAFAIKYFLNVLIAGALKIIDPIFASISLFS